MLSWADDTHEHAAGPQVARSRRRLSRDSAMSGADLKPADLIHKALSRLHAADAHATSHDLLIGRSVLPSGLQARLRDAGYRTLGDIAQSVN